MAIDPRLALLKAVCVALEASTDPLGRLPDAFYLRRMGPFLEVIDFSLGSLIGCA